MGFHLPIYTTLHPCTVSFINIAISFVLHFVECQPWNGRNGKENTQSNKERSKKKNFFRVGDQTNRKEEEKLISANTV